MPCRLCGRMYGGHEAAKTLVMYSCIAGHQVCKKCNDRADKINERTGLGIKYDPRWKANK